MDYEKLYKEALNKAKSKIWNDKGHVLYENDIIEILPELAESEDERIRKSLIEHIKGIKSWNYFLGISREQMISWLEKQGEQNPIDEYVVPETPIKDSEVVTSRMKYIDENLKPIAEFIIRYANWDLRKDEWNHPVATVPLFRVLDALVQNGKQYSEEYSVVDNNIEPKFRNGQWIVWQDRCYKVNYNGCGYELVDQNGLSTSSNYEDVDENAHIWDVTKDTNDGDVLVYPDGSITLFRKMVENLYMAHILLVDGHIELNNSCAVFNANPATKEQRGLLFQKIKEAGYEWDSKMKQLIKLY